jgi:hypothetical protein
VVDWKGPLPLLAGVTVRREAFFQLALSKVQRKVQNNLSLHHFPFNSPSQLSAALRVEFNGRYRARTCDPQLVELVL